MAIRLTEKQVRYAVLRCTGGKKTTAAVAGDPGVTQRRIQQLCARMRSPPPKN